LGAKIKKVLENIFFSKDFQGNLNPTPRCGYSPGIFLSSKRYKESGAGFFVLEGVNLFWQLFCHFF